MPNYRADQLQRIFEKLDLRTQTDDDAVLSSENAVTDSFTPISEMLSPSDTVEVSAYTPSTFVWGTGGSPTTVEVLMTSFLAATATNVDVTT